MMLIAFSKTAHSTHTPATKLRQSHYWMLIHTVRVPLVALTELHLCATVKQAHLLGECREPHSGRFIAILYMNV